LQGAFLFWEILLALGCIPESKRVQVPPAPGFYRSCAVALTDGFRPQSGLVQRELYSMAADSRHTVFPKAKRGAPLRGRLYRRVMFASLKGRWGKTVFPKVRRFRRHAAPGFYRSCAGALTDGFGPGTAAPSGLVQRGVIMPPVGGRCLWQRKPNNRACGAWKCTPSVACGDVSPGGGDFSDAIL
jgi:hypothetical protein